MANKVASREVPNMPGYYEFDYKNPQTNQRVRRKIEIITFSRNSCVCSTTTVNLYFCFK